jgi:hypothetical protein
MSRLQKKPPAHKRGHPTLQNMNFFYFRGPFLPSWIRIRIRIQITDPDPMVRLNTDPIWIRIRIRIRNPEKNLMKVKHISLFCRKISFYLRRQPAVPKNLDPTVTLILPAILEQKCLYPKVRLDTFQMFFFLKSKNVHWKYLLFLKIALPRNMEEAYH